MTLTTFKESLSHSNAPVELSPYLKSLWYDAKDNWGMAHTIIQDIEDKNAAWIHAYLHRKEGDIWNAEYWYRRADRQRPSASISEEWEQIATYFLKQVNLPRL